MKNLKFLLTVSILLILSAANFNSQAQDATGKSLPGSTYVTINVDAGDTVSAHDRTWYAQIDNFTDDPAKQDVIIEIDSVLGTGTIAVQLAGRKFDELGWTNIGSAVTWAGTASATNDTTIVISNATANRYRQYKVGLTETSTLKGKVAKLELKVWNE